MVAYVKVKVHLASLVIYRTAQVTYTFCCHYFYYLIFTPQKGRQISANFWLYFSDTTKADSKTTKVNQPTTKLKTTTNNSPSDDVGYLAVIMVTVSWFIIYWVMRNND